MLSAKSAVPTAIRGSSIWPWFERVATGGISLFTCPPGYLADESLAQALVQHERPLLWLRLGHEDQDPAVLLLSIIASARRLQPDIGARTLERMRLTPGPLMGWPALFNLLAQELVDGLPPATALVLEQIHYLPLPTLELISDQLLAGLPAAFSLILTSHQSLPASALPSHLTAYNAEDLKIDYAAGMALAQAQHADLSRECLQKAVTLCQGRCVVLSGMILLCQDLGASVIQETVLRAKSADQLLARLARVRLERASMEEVHALLLTQHLEYCHAELSQAALGSPALPVGPWMQLLSDGWQRLRLSWQVALQAAVQTDPWAAEARGLLGAGLVGLADQLTRQGALTQAVELCLGLGDTPLAARLMAAAGDEMMDTGQWSTLVGWLYQLPEQALLEQPRLVYLQGELAAVGGSLAEARRSFSLSSSLYYNQGETRGACQSLLAESTVCAWQGEHNQARSTALSAREIARQVGDADLLSAADWQLASLAVTAERLDEALAFLSEAGERLSEPSLAAWFEQNLRRVQNLRALQTQRHRQHAEYMQILQDEQGQLIALQDAIGSPFPDLPALLARGGWSGTPLMLKLRGFSAAEEQTGGGAGIPEPEAGQAAGLLGRLFLALRPRQEREPSGLSQAEAASLEGPAPFEPVPEYVPPVESRDFPRIAPEQPATPVKELPTGEPVSSTRGTGIPARPGYRHASRIRPRLGTARQPGRVSPAMKPTSTKLGSDQDVGRVVSPTSSPAKPVIKIISPSPPYAIRPAVDEPRLPISRPVTQPGSLALVVYCLGAFRVFQQDKEISEWSSYKARDILKYLLVRPGKPATGGKQPGQVPKDILIDIFWPEADPPAGRRNLHQAIYSLRQTLRGEQPEFHHIWFENDNYFLNPKLDIWLDFREFERCAQEGRRLEKAGQLEQAIEQYATAEQLYQGDFLQEDLYEDWPRLQREDLLNQYVGVVERLSELYLQKHLYAAVVPICQKLLSRDRANETAHRQLMLCYLAQGLRHLAVRQYQACLRALSEELGLPPSAETTALYRSIVSPEGR